MKQYQVATRQPTLGLEIIDPTECSTDELAITRLSADKARALNLANHQGINTWEAWVIVKEQA